VQLSEMIGINESRKVFRTFTSVRMLPLPSLTPSPLKAFVYLRQELNYSC